MIDEYLMGERKIEKLKNNLQNNVNCNTMVMTTNTKVIIILDYYGI